MLCRNKWHDSSCSSLFIFFFFKETPPRLHPLLTSSPTPLMYFCFFCLTFFFSPPSFPRREDQMTGSRGRQKGFAAFGEQTNLFPRAQHRLHLRAHHRAPREPLKPVFPQHERRQTKIERDAAEGGEPRGGAFDPPVLGHDSEGFLPGGPQSPVCPSEVRCAKMKARRGCFFSLRLFLYGLLLCRHIARRQGPRENK